MEAGMKLVVLITLTAASCCLSAAEYADYFDAKIAGINAGRKKNWQESATAYLTAVKLTKDVNDKVYCLNQAGQAWRNAKKYDKAIEAYRKITEQKNVTIDQVAAANLRTGDIQRTSRKYPEAIKSLNKVVAMGEKIHPNIRLQAYYYLGHSLLSTKKYKEARQAFLNGEKFPDGSKYYQDNCKFYAANTYRYEKKYPKAIKEFYAIVNDKSIDVKTRANAMAHVGYSLRETGKYPEAIKAFSRAAKIYSNSNYYKNYAVYNSAYSYYLWKKYKKAVELYLKAAKFKNLGANNNANSYLMAGISYLRLKDKVKAKECLEKVKSLKDASSYYKKKADSYLKQCKQPVMKK